MEGRGLIHCDVAVALRADNCSTSSRRDGQRKWQDLNLAFGQPINLLAGPVVGLSLLAAAPYLRQLEGSSSLSWLADFRWRVVIAPAAEPNKETPTRAGDAPNLPVAARQGLNTVRCLPRYPTGSPDFSGSSVDRRGTYE